MSTTARFWALLLLAIALYCLLSPTKTLAKPPSYTEKDITTLAKVLYREGRGVSVKAEQAAILWCVLNRVDAWDQTIQEVVKSPSQFAWDADTPVEDAHYKLAQDVLLRWELEKTGLTVNAGRTLPSNYLFFASREDGRNYFRTEYRGGIEWDWSYSSPYAETTIIIVEG